MTSPSPKGSNPHQDHNSDTGDDASGYPFVAHARLTNLSPADSALSVVTASAVVNVSAPPAADATHSNPVRSLPSVRQTGADAAPLSFRRANSSSAFLMRAFIPISENATQVSSSDIFNP